jgi:hypothetical protein
MKRWKLMHGAALLLAVALAVADFRAAVSNG